jgi:SM-20-related protein
MKGHEQSAMSDQNHQGRRPAAGRVTVTRAFERAGALPEVLRITDLLSQTDRSFVLDGIAERIQHFRPSTTLAGGIGYRRSNLLHARTAGIEWFDHLLDSLIPQAVSGLGIKPFEVARTVVQCTWHGDGDYYRIHNDNGMKQANGRVLSFVYYAHREPRGFTGGELVFYEYGADRADLASSRQLAIEPLGNSIVFFPSDAEHEVNQVTCASPKITAGRVTLNGWVSR